MGLTEIKVEIPVAGTEATDDLLLELGVEGWSLLEDAIAKRAWIVGVFTTEPLARMRWAELGPLLPVPPLAEGAMRTLADCDWRDSYKAHFKAWCFGRLHWVPIWERSDFRLPAGDTVLWLDPGMAFGTGNHETTRLCIERLVSFAEKNGVSGRVIDAGCGSGILALSAALLEFSEVVGFDNDPDAVRVSNENAALNRLSERVQFATADLTRGLGQRQAEVVLANIQADVLKRFAAELIATVVPGGSLVLSGILASELSDVRTRFMVPNAWMVR